jgi:hypothetical protein
MKTFFSTLFFTILFFTVNGQAPYFQQTVNNKIDVTLDDKTHNLIGTIQIEYTNNSPDELGIIYIHLWPNAYKNNETAFAKQQVRTGSTGFYFAEASRLGRISKLNFTVNGKEVKFESDPKHEDIGIVQLNAPLKSGETIIITTPFEVKIPNSFSRLGRVGQSYQMTQWYPKPAVYDRNGWHPMPYLDMGEFYSEFGSFDVKITLPDNYVVGATGTLQTESEKLFLKEKIKETDAYFEGLDKRDEGYVKEPFPDSSPTLKTIHYTAENVHDFGWFADKRFKVRKDEVTLASGKKVDTWVMFTKTNEQYWEKAIDYVGRSVQFYSEQVGEYPYPQATAIQSALSAGGGMEYPMITVIGRTGSDKALDDVITHEVGHNWFYGILASNERNHAWMDEGLNSFYEHRYMTKYYGSADDSDYIPEFLMKDTEMNLFELAYLFFKRNGKSQACDTPSDDFYAPNYLIGAYLKPPVILRYLENYVGLEAFDKAMQTYYSEWKFKHPQPEDFKKVMEESLGKELPWVFDDLFRTDKGIDYALNGIEDDGSNYYLTVKNKGEIAGPFSISAKKDDKVVATKWYEGVSDKTEVAFPKGEYDLLVLDNQRVIPETYRKNNNLKPTGVFKKYEPIQFKFLGSVENDKRSTIYYLPVPAYNVYDGFMLGAAFYNTAIPSKRLQFRVLPMYGFKSKSLAGVGDIHYNFSGGELFRNIRVGLNVRKFHNDINEKDDYDLSYERYKPYIDFTFNTNPAFPITHKISLNGIIVDRQEGGYNPDGSYYGIRGLESEYFLQAIYNYQNNRVVNPNSLQLGVEANQFAYINPHNNHIKAWMELNAAYTYKSKRSIDVRIFAGGFLKNPESSSFPPYPDAFNLSAQGYNDYRFDDFYFGRSEGTGFWSNQISGREGGMKFPIGHGFSLGRSGSFIAAINLRADLPKKLPGNLPLKPYFDIGYYHDENAVSNKDNIIWNGGLLLEFLGGRAEVYFPIVGSKNLQDRFIERGKFFSRIGFKIDLNNSNPWELLEDALVP